MRIGIDITVLNEKNKTGIGVYTYNLIKALLENDPENEYVLFGFSTFSTFEYLKSTDLGNYPNVSVKVMKIPARSFRTLFKIWQKVNFPSIEKFIGKVDIYHSFNFYLPPQKDGKTVATIFDMTSLKFPNLHHKRTSELDEIRMTRIAKKADLVISISESAKKDFLEKYPNKNVEVVYPAVSDQFEDDNKKDLNGVLKKYGIGGKYFISVATLEPRKNLEFLLKALLKYQGKEQLVLVGGSGWKNEDLLELIKDNSEEIILTGFVTDEELVELYKGAICLIYPSLYEGFGIPVLEALSLGVPVICSNTSSLPEVGGDAVIYIDPTNEEDLLKSINQIAMSEKKRGEMRRKGFLQAKKFSYNKSARKLLELYSSLAK
jgi:glycosyltransferase involved in cell wall biosynthesis